MEHSHTWIKEMKNDVFNFNKLNPHLTTSSLQHYLAYYSFDITAFTTYRCGTVEVQEKKIFIQAFLRENSKGTIYFVHGYLDHTGGMSRTINKLLNDGYDVISLDLPGHGFSQGESGSIASFDDYVEAVEKGYYVIEETLNRQNIIGLGHSTGGGILFHAASENKVNLARLVLVAPLYIPYGWNMFKGVLKTAGKIIPRSKRRFKKNSEDYVYRDFIKNDPLQVKLLSSSWVLAMEEWQKRIISCPILDIPVYCLQGGKDTTVDWKKNVSFYEQKCRRIQIALFPNGRHQLLNESNVVREFVYERIRSYLEDE
ncbi:alpha/beta hydrolase [Salipaludibacillus agaradhaerens]|uniref:Alpha/beta hydrolase n=1 Tax=Salipaludibacillus agaradhaerens TaxID=76935 RepID=A0A9Q4B128_SALAG|nr:alpha/beta hydrolase [Salipaludibacillus agaradhaerens]MCR6096221.1 alpha/beta hydrolase [Salipaludibacillus agaradhaerens]MCR6114220.1 alpha/beta hydrolase [Salipaludibacillus agaradhaerens]